MNEHTLTETAINGLISANAQLTKENAELKALVDKANSVGYGTAFTLQIERIQRERDELKAKLEQAESEFRDASGLLDGQNTLYQELSAKCAEMQSALEYWQEMYPKELASANRQIEWCKKEKDSHGENFNQGLRAGLIDHDIFLTRFKRACESDCGKPILERVKRLRAAGECVSDSWSKSKNPDWDGMADAVAKMRVALAETEGK